MKKACEEYLIYGVRNRSWIDPESLGCIQRQEVDGVLYTQVIPKDTGVLCFWNHRGMKTLESRIGESGEKEFVTQITGLLEVLQRIKRQEQLSLDSVVLDADTIYVDESDGEIFLPVLPVKAETGEWEGKLRKAICTLLEKSKAEGTEFGQSLRVLLSSELVEPENLSRNLQLMVQKLQEEASWKAMVRTEPEKEKKASTEELNWKAKMEKSVQGKAVHKTEKKEPEETTNGVFFRRFHEKPEEKPETGVVSGKLDAQPSEENIKKDTQVLRKNMLNTGNIGATSGFASVAPVQLNQKKEGAAESQKMQSENAQKQLHFVSFGTSAGVDILIDKSYFVLGKWAAQVDGVIGYTPTISRTHCALHRNGEDVYIEDLGSANGTFVNDKKLEPYEGVKITPKDTIRLAREGFAIAYR